MAHRPVRQQSVDTGDELIRVNAQDLRDEGVPEAAIDALMEAGTVEPTALGTTIIIDVASLLLGLTAMLAAGTISQFVFAHILDFLDIAPWD